MSSFKLQYLQALAERLKHPSAEYPFLLSCRSYTLQRDHILAILADFFLDKPSVTSFALLNQYGGEERKKYLSAKKLGNLQAKPGQSLQDKFTLSMLQVERNFSSDYYAKGIVLPILSSHRKTPGHHQLYDPAEITRQ
jgi:hypothetical protein